MSWLHQWLHRNCFTEELRDEIRNQEQKILAAQLRVKEVAEQLEDVYRRLGE